jgi:hypothetical protein
VDPYKGVVDIFVLMDPAPRVWFHALEEDGLMIRRPDPITD